MARPRSVAGGRRNVVCVRLSAAEAADLDGRRGALERGAFLRFLLIQARKQGVQFGGGHAGEQ